MKNSQVAVFFSVDSKTVMFLSKTVPDMLTHTETNPTASLATKGSANPTNIPVKITVGNRRYMQCDYIYFSVFQKLPLY